LISSNEGYQIETRKNLFLDIVQKYKDEHTGYRGNGKKIKTTHIGKICIKHNKRVFFATSRNFRKTIMKTSSTMEGNSLDGNPLDSLRAQPLCSTQVHL
jgi:hypothetical protein